MYVHSDVLFVIVHWTHYSSLAAAGDFPFLRSVSSMSLFFDPDPNLFARAEAVLSLLLESFVFDVVPNQNVVWVNGWLAYPTTEEGSADTPHLPLRVSRVNPT
jgi:hypothetical protein